MLSGGGGDIVHVCVYTVVNADAHTHTHTRAHRAHTEGDIFIDIVRVRNFKNIFFHIIFLSSHQNIPSESGFLSRANPASIRGQRCISSLMYRIQSYRAPAVPAIKNPTSERAWKKKKNDIREGGRWRRRAIIEKERFLIISDVHTWRHYLSWCVWGTFFSPLSLSRLFFLPVFLRYQVNLNVCVCVYMRTQKIKLKAELKNMGVIWDNTLAYTSHNYNAYKMRVMVIFEMRHRYDV